MNIAQSMGYCVFLYISKVSEIPNPPQHHNGEVNAHSFWEAVTMEVVSLGLYPRKSGGYFNRVIVNVL